MRCVKTLNVAVAAVDPHSYGPPPIAAAGVSRSVVRIEMVKLCVICVVVMIKKSLYSHDNERTLTELRTDLLVGGLLGVQGVGRTGVPRS